MANLGIQPEASALETRNETGFWVDEQEEGEIAASPPESRKSRIAAESFLSNVQTGMISTLRQKHQRLQGAYAEAMTQVETLRAEIIAAQQTIEEQRVRLEADNKEIKKLCCKLSDNGYNFKMARNKLLAVTKSAEDNIHEAKKWRERFEKCQIKKQKYKRLCLRNSDRGRDRDRDRSRGRDRSRDRSWDRSRSRDRY
jgi:hypothetical protein